MHYTNQQLEQRIDSFLSRKFKQFPEISEEPVTRFAMRQIARTEK